MWFPCVDTLVDKCTFSMEITVDKDMMAVCSGELVDQVWSDDYSKKTFFFNLDVPSVAQSVALAVGPFEVRHIGRSQSIIWFSVNCLFSSFCIIASSLSFRFSLIPSIRL